MIDLTTKDTKNHEKNIGREFHAKALRSQRVAVVKGKRKKKGSGETRYKIKEFKDIGIPA